VIIDRNVLE
jgi:hypothetical protein